MTEGTRKQPRLVLLCGLPASGKTALAREIADAYGAVRLNPDEWELALGIDPFDAEFQVRLEAEFSRLTERLIALGTSVILEWGFWARSERDEKRDLGRSLGAAVELRFLDVPYEELVRRVVARHAAGGIAVTEIHMERYLGSFQPPNAHLGRGGSGASGSNPFIAATSFANRPKRTPDSLPVSSREMADWARLQARDRSR